MTNRLTWNARLAALGVADPYFMESLHPAASEIRPRSILSRRGEGAGTGQSRQSEKGSIMTDDQPSTSPAPANWHQRADQFHEQRWALAQDLLALGRRILRS